MFKKHEAPEKARWVSFDEWCNVKPGEYVSIGTAGSHDSRGETVEQFVRAPLAEGLYQYEELWTIEHNSVIGWRWRKLEDKES